MTKVHMSTARPFTQNTSLFDKTYSWTKEQKTAVDELLADFPCTIERVINHRKGILAGSVTIGVRREREMLPRIHDWFSSKNYSWRSGSMSGWKNRYNTWYRFYPFGTLPAIRLSGDVGNADPVFLNTLAHRASRLNDGVPAKVRLKRLLTQVAKEEEVELTCSYEVAKHLLLSVMEQVAEYDIEKRKAALRQYITVRAYTDQDTGAKTYSVRATWRTMDYTRYVNPEIPTRLTDETGLVAVDAYRIARQLQLDGHLIDYESRLLLAKLAKDIADEVAGLNSTEGN